MNQNHVGAGLLIGGRTRQRLGLTKPRNQRFRASDDDEIRAGPRCDRRRNLALKLFRPHQFLTAVSQQARHFRKGLVLYDYGRRPCPFVFALDVHDVDSIAEAGVDVRYHRDGDLAGDGARHIEMLRHRQQAKVWQAVERGEFETRRPQSVDPASSARRPDTGLCVAMT